MKRTGASHLRLVDDSAKLLHATIQNRYRVERLLDRDDLGESFVAVDASNGSQVGIKFLSAERADDPEAVQRFIRPGQAASLPEHTNLITTIGSGEHEGRPYLLFKFVDGVTLSERVSAGPVPLRTAVRITRQLCDALEHIHSCGRVHGNITTNNIVLDPATGRVVLDFGFFHSEHPHHQPMRVVQVQVTSPDYLAPERATEPDGKDPRSDLYSLGVVFYELITGRLPFQATSTAELLLQHMFTTPPKPSDVVDVLSSAVDEVVAKTLEKEPGNRYPSAAAFSEAVGALTASERRSMAPNTPPPPNGGPPPPPLEPTVRPPLAPAAQARVARTMPEPVPIDSLAPAAKPKPLSTPPPEVVPRAAFNHDTPAAPLAAAVDIRKETLGPAASVSPVPPVERLEPISEERLAAVSPRPPRKPPADSRKIMLWAAVVAVLVGAPVALWITLHPSSDPVVVHDVSPPAPTRQPTRVSSSAPDRPDAPAPPLAPPLLLPTQARKKSGTWTRGATSSKRAVRKAKVSPKKVAVKTVRRKADKRASAKPTRVAAAPASGSKPAEAPPVAAPAVGKLSVVSEPPGAIIYVAGRKVGAAPIAGLELEPGKHTVRADRVGYESWRGTAVVRRGGQVALQAVLPAKPAILHVVTQEGQAATWAKIAIDGVVVSQTHMARKKVNPGKHSISVRRSGYQTVQKVVDVSPGTVKKIRVSLKRI